MDNAKITASENNKAVTSSPDNGRLSWVFQINKIASESLNNKPNSFVFAIHRRHLGLKSKQ